MLEEKEIPTDVIEYLKKSWNPSELQSLLSKLTLKPSQLLRKKEPLVKKLKLDIENEELIFQALLNYPILIERPILVCGQKAVIGRPLENLNLIL